MQKKGYVRVIIAGLLLGGLGSVTACGDSEGDNGGGSSGSSGNAGSPGKGGSGGTPVTGPVECGSEMCQPLLLPVADAPPVAACCTDDGGCGLDSSVLEAFGPTFEEQCQARDQPGELDPACPNSTTTMVMGVTLEFDGCCRANGRCGYMLDSLLGVYEIGLGCVDSEPFLAGETAPACGDGAGGSTGEGGAGGAPSAPAAGGAAGSGTSDAGAGGG